MAVLDQLVRRSVRVLSVRVTGGALLLVASAACGGAAAEPVKHPQAEQASRMPLDEEPPTGRDLTELDLAVSEMDAGKLDSARARLEGLHQRLPANALVLHELGLAWRLTKQPGKAVALLAPYEAELGMEMVAGLVAAYDEAGDSEGARSVIDRGLKRFPKAGLLHSARGSTFATEGKLNEALESFERGIAVDPAWPSNYLHAATLYASTKARGMALVYGEIFRNLEPSSERSQALAKVMAEIYSSAITIEEQGEETKLNISLAPNAVSVNDDSATIPLLNQYEIAMGLALAAVLRSGFSIATLHKARATFVEIWQERSAGRAEARVPLFDWQLKLLKAGHFEAYNYWLLAPAYAEEAETWAAKHSDELREMSKFASELGPPIGALPNWQ
jgi:tetratricopeptide (TPR) repeat protein